MTNRVQPLKLAKDNNKLQCAGFIPLTDSPLRATVEVTGKSMSPTQEPGDKLAINMEKQKRRVAEISVSYHPKHSLNPVVTCSIHAYVLFKAFFPTDTIHLQERFVAMYLNRANRLIGLYLVSIGGTIEVIADIRLILSVALKTAATSIMLAHNHPSGALSPSPADRVITSQIHEAANLMDIKLLDHIILSPKAGEYYSFVDDGML